MRLLAVAAFDPELEEFRRLTGSVRAETVGIGLVDAALGTAELVARVRPDVVLLLGTCGVFAGEAPPPEVIVGAALLASDGPTAEGRGALVGPLAEVTEVPRALVDAAHACGAEPALVATSLSITTDDALAAACARAATRRAPGHAVVVEHLEALAVGRACARAGVPCLPILGVANTVGASGRAEWAARHVEASARAAAIAARLAVGDALREALGIRTTTTPPSPARG